MTTVLELSDVSFVRNGRRILDGIDLEVRAGEHWALIGPNGAGKSTILSLCGALQHPTGGVVTVLGQRIGRGRAAAAAAVDRACESATSADVGADDPRGGAERADRDDRARAPLAADL